MLIMSLKPNSNGTIMFIRLQLFTKSQIKLGLNS